MQHAFRTPNTNVSDLESLGSLDVVIAYQDFETGKLAKRTYDFLVHQLGSQFLFSNHMWKFEVLNLPKLREIAATETADADIIIFSSHGDLDIPPAVSKWFDLWTSQECRALALVALFDCDPEQSYSLRCYLANAARRARAEFFAQPDHWAQPGDLVAPAIVPEANRLASRALTSLTGVFNASRGFQRWDINE
jgi:hypothetical protein